MVMTAPDGKPSPTEFGGEEAGYVVFLQLLALLGLHLTPLTAAIINAIAFLFSGLILSITIGFLIGPFWPSTLLVATFIIFSYHFESGIVYGFIGPWTLLTGTGFLAISVTLWISLSKKTSIAVFITIISIIFTGLMDILRESEAYILAFTSISSLLMRIFVLERSSRLISIRMTSLSIVFVIMTGISLFLSASLATRWIILHHRSSKTGLSSHPYNGGMVHGSSHVLLMSLGRYQNPYGYYFADYFPLSTACKKMQSERFPNSIKSKTYKCNDFNYLPSLFWLGKKYDAFVGKILWTDLQKHPLYDLYYLGRATLDYTMFIPYSIFLDKTHVPNGAILPVIVPIYKIANDDRSIYLKVHSDGTFVTKRSHSALVNLKPSYFYLSFFEWLWFFVLLSLFLVPSFVAFNGKTTDRLLAYALYLEFAIYSAPRVLVPMHGWSATTSFEAIAFVGAAILLKNTTQKCTHILNKTQPTHFSPDRTIN